MNSLTPKTDKLKSIISPTRSKKLNYGALACEFLSLFLTLSWAWSARDGGSFLFSLAFCAGFIAFIVFKGQAIHFTVQAIKQSRYGLALLCGFLAIASLLMLLATSVFDVTNANGDAVAERLEASKPAQALDESINIARERLANLAPFADAAKAADDEASTKAHNSQIQQQIATIQGELGSLVYPPVPSPHNRYMNQDCSPKTTDNGIPYTSRAAKGCEVYKQLTASIDSKKAQLLAQLSSLRSQSSHTADYASKHAEYLGVQQHLQKLVKERAELSENGQGVAAIWRTEDLILADILGVTPDKANAIKWLVFAACFDLLSLIARVIATLVSPAGNQEEEARRKMSTLLANGFTLEESINALHSSKNNLLAAKVSRPHLDNPIEPLETGGRILEEGIYHGHENEIVLNATATQFLDLQYPQLLENLNLLQYDRGTALSNINKILSPKTAVPAAISAAVPQNAVLPADNAAQLGSTTQRSIPPKKRRTTTPSTGKASRVGGTDKCKHCGTEFKVKTWNHYFCSKQCKLENHGYL